MEGTRPTRTLSLMRRRFRVAARQCKAECRAHRQENRVADQLWPEVDGLPSQVLTGIYSAESHLPQPLRISVCARRALADHYEATMPLSGSKDYMHLKFQANEGIGSEEHPPELMSIM